MICAYDSNGSTATKTETSGLTQYTWDYENRLTRVTLPGGSQVNFKYDPFGRRIQKTSSSGTTNYVYDGANVLEEVDTAATSSRATRRTERRAGNTRPSQTNGLRDITVSFSSRCEDPPRTCRAPASSPSGATAHPSPRRSR